MRTSLFLALVALGVSGCTATVETPAPPPNVTYQQVPPPPTVTYQQIPPPPQQTTIVTRPSY